MLNRRNFLQSTTSGALVITALPAIRTVASTTEATWKIYVINDNCPDYTWGNSETEVRRNFAGRFLGHGFPFQDSQNRWWCTAFYNGNIPPISRADLKKRPLPDTAYTINRMGTTIVPLEVKIQDDGDISIRAKDPDYASPGPDEVQQFSFPDID